MNPIGKVFIISWGTPVEKETRNRIHLAAAAYAYEIENDPIMSDAVFDKMALDIDLSIETTNPAMDEYFKKYFEPFTGQWIHHHPDKEGLAKVAARLRSGKVYID